MVTIPIHVAVIPDGNRRWARKNNLPDVEGHRIASEKTLPRLIEKSMDMGVKYFTFWALSTENAKKRSPEENRNLENLMRLFLRTKTQEFHKKNIRMKVIGDTERFPADVQKLIQKAVTKTANNTGMTVIFAVNYGGRDEIMRAINRLILEQSGSKSESGITAEALARYLDTKDIPDPDLVVRTGGEQRISGFMLWQSEYAEYRFSDKLFPEFTEQDWYDCIQSFSARERRFGK
ncbi:MAG: polyprenyl diphosphate synthase [Patescibacteria group bacterium]